MEFYMASVQKKIHSPKSLFLVWNCKLYCQYYIDDFLLVAGFKGCTSMLVTAVGGEMRSLQVWDVGDGFDHFGHQYPMRYGSYL